MIHVMASFRSFPIRVVLPQFDVKAVQTAGGTDVKGVLCDFPYCGDSRKCQKKSEMVRKVFIGTSNGITTGQSLGLEVHSVCGQNELRFGFCGGGAFPQRSQCPRHRTGFARGNVDVVSLKEAA